VNLEVLELRENLIRLLPSSLGSLGRLQSLDLGSNLIDDLVCRVILCVTLVCVACDNFRKTLKTHLFRNALGHLAH